jgi:hypothetical protein
MVIQIVGDAFTVGHRCQRAGVFTRRRESECHRGVVREVTHQIKIIDVERLLSFAGDGNDWRSDSSQPGPLARTSGASTHPMR